MVEAPRRIVFVLPDLAGGGAQRVLTSFAADLDPRQFEPAFVVLGSERGPWADAAWSAGRVDALGARGLRQSLVALAARLRALSPDAIVSTMGYVNLAVLAMRVVLRRRTAIVVREANELSATIDSLPSWLPGRWAYRRFYPTADLVIAPSRAILATLAHEAGVPPARLVRIANPTDEVALRAAASTPRRMPGAGLRLVAAGRLTRQKGIDRLLDVLPLLPRDTHVLIFGDGPERGALEARISAENLVDRVTLRPFTPELPAWIAGADALVVPSRWEGMPNVALEALAVGTPVIGAPEAGGLAELATETAAVRLPALPSAFAAEVGSLVLRSSGTIGPCLLPDSYRRAVASRAFARSLDQVLRGRPSRQLEAPGA
ncbi:MAG: glycosyltransferase [Alphaproteobacteria bacterium]|nr:glycosyltransferase [Alphaproteobacteria bacterium]